MLCVSHRRCQSSPVLFHLLSLLLSSNNRSCFRWFVCCDERCCAACLCKCAVCAGNGLTFDPYPTLSTPRPIHAVRQSCPVEVTAAAAIWSADGFKIAALWQLLKRTQHSHMHTPHHTLLNPDFQRSRLQDTTECNTTLHISSRKHRPKAIECTRTVNYAAHTHTHTPHFTPTKSLVETKEHATQHMAVRKRVTNPIKPSICPSKEMDRNHIEPTTPSTPMTTEAAKRKTRRNETSERSRLRLRQGLRLARRLCLSLS